MFISFFHSLKLILKIYLFLKKNDRESEKKQGLLRNRIIGDSNKSTAQFHLPTKQMSLNWMMGKQSNENGNE